MPRTARMVIPNEQAVYHVMSRTALDGFPIGSVEKDFLLKLIKRFSKLYLAEILGFCLILYDIYDRGRISDYKFTLFQYSVSSSSYAT